MLGHIIAFCVIVNLHSSNGEHTNDQTIHNTNINHQDTTVNTPKLNRLPPPYIESVKVGDISFYLDNTRNQDRSMSTTYLMAIDSNYEELWRLAVYETVFDKELETDVQEVYPISLDYNCDNHSFVVENENGSIFTIDLTTFEVREMK